MKVDKEAILDLAMSKNIEELHLKDVKLITPCPSRSCAVHHQSLGILIEDNIRMRQEMNSMLLTMMQWIRQNKEQTEQVRLLMQMLKETDKQRENERNLLQQNLDAMAIKMKAGEAYLATERQNRLLANREKEVAKQLILKLQEENWGLRKARSALIPRDGNSHSANGFPSQLSSSRFDCPR